MSSVDQVFVGRDEKRAPLKTKTPAWEASLHPVFPYNIAVSSVFVCVCVCVCVCGGGGGGGKKPPPPPPPPPPQSGPAIEKKSSFSAKYSSSRSSMSAFKPDN